MDNEKVKRTRTKKDTIKVLGIAVSIKGEKVILSVDEANKVYKDLGLMLGKGL